MAKSKSTEYKPDAIDADGDGIVQEGTEWERPVGTLLEVEAEEVPVEGPEPAVEAVEAPVATGTYKCGSGDSYASVAAALAPKGMRWQDYAKELRLKNNDMRLAAGVTIKL